MQLAPGARLGDYEILDLLGSGGMGQVFKARDVRLQRMVAIKVIGLDDRRHPELRERFRREARAAAAVTHPHICTLYDVGQQDDADFLVLQYLEGETLATRLARGRLPVESVLGIGIEISEALAAAHRARLVHRDLKPGNIMLTSDGAKLLDFGIATVAVDEALRDLDNPLARTLTGPGQLLGTLQYMAPEQLQHLPLDGRADLFAFGAVAYEMLTGTAAFERRSVAETIAAVVDGTVVPLKAARPDTPAALARIVTSCLAVDRTRRWQSAADLAAALKAIATRKAQRGKTRTAASPAHAGTIRSLAVLPFEIGNPDDTEQYLADGLAESLIDSIAQIARVKVISRASSMRFRTRIKPVREFGSELRADGIVCGSVSLSGTQLSVTTSLLRTSDGATLWSDRIDRSITDLFQVQWQIAETIAAELNLRLRSPDRRRHRRAPLPDANQEYLQGRYFWNKDTPECLQRSFRHLTAAVQRDPGYARFHSALADWYLSAGNQSLVPIAEALPKAKASALRARELDPDLAETYSCLGRVAMQECDLKRALAEFDNSLQLNASLLEPLVWSAQALSFLGLHDQALARVTLAKQLDPVSPRPRVAAAMIHYIADEYDQAVDESRAALDLDPQRPTAFYYMGLAQFHRGQLGEAMDSLESAARYSQRHPAALSALMLVLAASGRCESALGILDEMKERATRAQVSPYYFAEAYLALGDVEKCLQYLRRSQELNLPDIIGIGVDPVFRSLRGEPDFEKIVQSTLSGGG